MLPNGNEIALGTFLVTSWDEQEQVIRAVSFQYADEQRINNPSWQVIIYGPTDGWYWTIDDRIWDSAVNL